MSDTTADDADPAASDSTTAVDVWDRETAPQTPYTSREVGIGFVVFVIGVIVTFGVPLVLA